MERYGARVIGRQGITFGYARLRPAVNLTAVDRRMSLHLAPRLAWTLVTRLQSRGERVEAGSKVGRAAVVAPIRAGAVVAGEEASVPWRPPSVPPMPRIVRRARAEATDDERPRTTNRPKGEEWEADVALRGQRPPAPTPAVDVNRLTESVIQAIDRRIIAQRERMGRM
jgi:hypothetical protein